MTQLSSNVNRHVVFECCFNFRDLGGYTTTDGRQIRWGRLYRSDALHRLNASDVEVFAGMGLRTVIDLRSQTEIDDHGRAPEAAGRAWHHLPMLDQVKLAPPEPGSEPERTEPPPPGEGYLAISERYSESIAQVFRLLGEPAAYPAVFHCTAGKDRTGILAALILDVLGVPDDVIGEDYGLTESVREKTMAWIEVNEPDYFGYLAAIPVEWRIAAPEKILAFLRLLREKHGSVTDWLRVSGVSDTDLASLRDQLLED